MIGLTSMSCKVWAHSSSDLLVLMTGARTQHFVFHANPYSITGCYGDGDPLTPAQVNFFRSLTQSFDSKIDKIVGQIRLCLLVFICFGMRWMIVKRCPAGTFGIDMKYHSFFLDVDFKSWCTDARMSSAQTAQRH